MLTAYNQWKKMTQKAGAFAKKTSETPYIRHMLAQTAICVALLLTVLALKTYLTPMRDDVTDTISSAVTTDMNLGETLGRLKLVQYLVDHAQMVFSSEKLQPPCDGEIVQSFAENGKGCVYVSQSSGVYAAADGEVLEVLTASDGSFALRISHSGALETVYAGLQGVLTAKGDQVTAGQQLGYLLQREPGFLLYFAAEKNGEAVDPASLFG